jgi:glycosyltransferase involved in cell wall biosynthesis
VIDLEYKGHDLVLEAMSNLKKKGIDFNYIIAGKGDSKRLNDLAIKLGVRNNVVFLGLIDHSEIEIFFEKIDIYVQPSRVEGLPRAVVEAMSFGCACIGSSSGGIPELLDEEAIFNSGSVESLTHKLKYFNNSEILISQSQINFEKSKNYSFDSLEKKRKAFYDKFLMSIDEK